MPNGTSSTETVLYNFCFLTVNCLDGGAPNSSVALDASGNIFGAATMGGGNNGNDNITGSGTLFELTQSKYSVLHRFCAERFCNDGQFPLAGVILDGAAISSAPPDRAARASPEATAMPAAPSSSSRPKID